ncbi:MAG: metallophosphoesterase [Actinomycetota bacterium]
MNLELVTVSDTRAVITWFTGDPTTLDEFQRPLPVAAPGRVLIGTSANPRTWRETGRHDSTAYHYVEVSGLLPGMRYFYRAESNGIPAVPTAVSPLNPDPSNEGVFETLIPPPGGEVMTVAWLNDLHMGEQYSGLAISDSRLPRGGFPPGFPADADNPYWRFMARSAVAEAKARGARLMFVNGDISNAAEPPVLAEAKVMLDGFGALGGTSTVTPSSGRRYFVTRGNHDRAFDGDPYARCPAVPGNPDFHDCFRETFAGGFDHGSTHWNVVVRNGSARWRFVGLDSADITTGDGTLPPSELEYLEAVLERGDPTIPMLHHTVGDQSILVALPPAVFGVRPDQAKRFWDVVAAQGNVAAVYSGHTHRNRRTRTLETGDVPFFEGGAVKEYPGGFTTVRLYEGGFMVNFWKTKDPDARAWSERSRGEYLGLYPYYTLGGLSDRNWVRTFG